MLRLERNTLTTFYGRACFLLCVPAESTEHLRHHDKVTRAARAIRIGKRKRTGVDISQPPIKIGQLFAQVHDVNIDSDTAPVAGARFDGVDEPPAKAAALPRR